MVSQASFILTREEGVIFRLCARGTAGRSPIQMKPPQTPPPGNGCGTCRVCDIKFAVMHWVSRRPVGMGPRKKIMSPVFAGFETYARSEISRNCAKFLHAHRFGSWRWSWNLTLICKDYYWLYIYYVWWRCDILEILPQFDKITSKKFSDEIFTVIGNKQIIIDMRDHWKYLR